MKLFSYKMFQFRFHILQFLPVFAPLNTGKEILVLNIEKNIREIVKNCVYFNKNP